MAAPKPKFAAKKTSAQVVSRSVSLSPPARLPLLVRSSRSASASPSPSPTPSAGGRKQVSVWRPSAWQEGGRKPASAWQLWACPERGRKPPSPWEAAWLHPLGLVDAAFTQHDLQRSLADTLHSAATRKQLPMPPHDWTARVSYAPPPRSRSAPSHSSALTRSHTPPRSPKPVPFLSPTKSSVSDPTPLTQTPPLSHTHTQTHIHTPSQAHTHTQTHTHSHYSSTYSSTWRR